MAFAVHGTAELSFAGGAAALLVFGIDASGWGALVGAVLVALRLRRPRTRAARARLRDRRAAGVRARPRGAVPVALHRALGSNKFGLLVGQIVGVDVGDVLALAVVRRRRARRARGGLPAAAVREPRPRGRRRARRAGARAVDRVRGAARRGDGARRADRRRAAGARAAGHAGRRGRAGHRVAPLRATVLAVVFAEVAVLGGIVLSLAPGCRSARSSPRSRSRSTWCAAPSARCGPGGGRRARPSWPGDLRRTPRSSSSRACGPGWSTRSSAPGRW